MKTSIKLIAGSFFAVALLFSVNGNAQGSGSYKKVYKQERSHHNNAPYKNNRAVKPLPVKPTKVSYSYAPGYTYKKAVVVNPHQRLRVLPVGYQTVRYNNVNYYRNGSTYYTYRSGYYEQVRMPIGARVSHLPNGTVTVWENGRNFYVANNTYFQAFVGARGLVNYEVVGYSY